MTAARLALVWLALVLVLVLLAGSARAAPSTPAAGADATAYHRAGVAAYRAGDYPAAVAAFEEAYRLGRQPDSLFALAQAYRKVYVDDHDPGILLRTVELYRLYLAQAPDGRQAASVRELLSNLDPLAELVRARQPAATATTMTVPTQVLVWSTVAGAQARLDGAAAAPLPLVREVAPGSHAVVVNAPGHDDSTLDVVAVADRLVVVEARPTPRPARLTVATAAGATLAIDGVLRGGGGGGVIELAPGRHRVWAGARGRLGVEEVLTLAPGQARRLELALRVSPRRRAARWVGVGAAALTALGAGAAGWAAVQAERATDLRGVLSTRPWTEAELGTYSDARDGRATWRGLAIGGFASAAVTAAVAGWLWVDDVPRPRP